MARSLSAWPVDISANCWSLTASGKLRAPAGIARLVARSAIQPVTCAIKNGAFRAIFMQQALLLDADYRGFTDGHATGQFDQLLIDRPCWR